MTNENLKPCPFCGGKAELETNEDGSMLHVTCTVCYARSDNHYAKHKNYVIQDWNKRTQTDSPISDELRTALAKLLTATRDVAVLIEP